MAGLATAFGSGAMTNSIAEIGDAKTILAIGTNTTSAHPIVALQIKNAVRKGAKLLVVNPKEVDLCQHATLFLQNKPGTDIPLLMAMARIIVEEGLADTEFIRQRCEGYAEFEQSLNDFSLPEVAKLTGVAEEKITEAARLYAQNTPSSILYCMGITQHVHGTKNVLAIANLAMLTGNVGKPSTGVNPLRGQNNVQGSCDMGSLPDVFPGYHKVADVAARQKFEQAWGVSLNPEPGLTHTEIFDALYSGEIKSLYLIGENPVLSEANASHAIEAMKRTDFMIVQDIFLSETAELADVVLPAASFAEKDGTFTNTERRVQRVRKALASEDEIKPDWWITAEIARRLDGKGFDFASSAEIFEEMVSLVPSYAGMTYKRLEGGGIQWPCTDDSHSGTIYLHKERFSTSSGKGRFTPLRSPETAEKVSEEFPLILTTDRSLFHFHGTMTRRVFGLNILSKAEKLIVHPEDAECYNIEEGEKVRVVSRRAAVEVEVRVADDCKPGIVSMSFHFSETPTNMLTCGEVDPIAKTPTTKVCAVRIEKILPDEEQEK